MKKKISPILPFIIIVLLMAMAAFSSKAFSTAMKSLDIKVDNLYCISCAMRIKTALDQMPGVGDVRISVSSKKIHVAYDDAKIPQNQILQKIKDLGYKAEVIKH